MANISNVTQNITIFGKYMYIHWSIANKFHAAIGALSFVLNATFLFTLARNRDLVKQKRVTYHVANLAVADSLHGLARLCSYLLLGSYHRGMLSIAVVFYNTTLFSSFLAVILMAIERTVVIKKPFTWAEILPLKKTLLAILGAWIVSLILSIAFKFFDHSFLVIMVSSLVGILLIVILNVHIAWRLQLDKRKSAAVLNNQQAAKHQFQRKPTVLVLLLAVITAVTCIPNVIIKVLYYKCSFKTYKSFIFIRFSLICSEMFLALNFLVNPILYIWKDRMYRKAFFRTFKIGLTNHRMQIKPCPHAEVQR